MGHSSWSRDWKALHRSQGIGCVFREYRKTSCHELLIRQKRTRHAPGFFFGTMLLSISKTVFGLTALLSKSAATPRAATAGAARTSPICHRFPLPPLPVPFPLPRPSTVPCHRSGWPFPEPPDRSRRFRSRRCRRRFRCIAVPVDRSVTGLSRRFRCRFRPAVSVPAVSVPPDRSRRSHRPDPARNPRHRIPVRDHPESPEPESPDPESPVTGESPDHRNHPSTGTTRAGIPVTGIPDPELPNRNPCPSRNRQSSSPGIRRCHRRWQPYPGRGIAKAHAPDRR